MKRVVTTLVHAVGMTSTVLSALFAVLMYAFYKAVNPWVLLLNTLVFLIYTVGLLACKFAKTEEGWDEKVDFADLPDF